MIRGHSVTGRSRSKHKKNMSNVQLQTNGYDSVQAMLRPHIKCAKGHWHADNDIIPDPENFRVAVVMPSMEAGEIEWRDSKPFYVSKQLVSKAGIPDGVSAGRSPYTSVLLLIEETGLLGTFTSSSWGGRTACVNLIAQYRMNKSAFPIVTLGTKPRGDMYGNVDPILKIIGRAPRAKFDAILGPEEACYRGSGGGG
jgi:hypothetical protein